ncbi:hypothetical protein EMGBD4_09440 [Verrucomicrobiota bacterium]|nr:hypothetical protein EMGBD4_09440 [Verrucomicrobiota bacterium]
MTAADVIAKAQAAMVKNPSALKSIKSLHLEAKITDAEGKGAGSLIVQVATPFKRREFAYNANHSPRRSPVPTASKAGPRVPNSSPVAAPSWASCATNP